MKVYLLEGKEVWLMSINELAKIAFVSARMLTAWEKRGILPKPYITEPIISTLPTIKTKNKVCNKRLYSEGQAKVLANWVSRVNPGRGVTIPMWLIAELHEQWEIATNKLKGELTDGNKDSRGYDS